VSGLWANEMKLPSFDKLAILESTQKTRLPEKTGCNEQPSSPCRLLGMELSLQAILEAFSILNK
jgi:hypothetical protein